MTIICLSRQTEMSVSAVMLQHLHKLKEPCDASAQSALKQPPFGNQSKHTSALRIQYKHAH